MGLGKQAKTLTKAQVDAALNYLSNSRHPLRNRAILLLSVKAGLRAKEIASLTWDMATTSDGEVGNAIHLTNDASKGRGGGRVIPLNRELRAALLSLRQSPSRGIPSTFVIATEPDYPNHPPSDRQPLLPLVSRPRLLGVLQPQRSTDLHHQRRSKDLDGRRVAAGHPVARRPLQPVYHPALHRVARRGAAQDRRAGVMRRVRVSGG
jgi:integrase